LRKLDKEVTAMATATHDAALDKVERLRELFADAPEVGKKALENVLQRLASDASLLSTVSSAFLPTSGASANSSRSWWILFSTVWSCSGLVSVSVAMSAFSSRFWST